MAYSELIKDFSRIRTYMRDFFVYGFKSRSEYDAKSARSYDNERRRIESWLGEYMEFHRDANGKNVFISVDSRSIPQNPLFQAFKAKTFTDNDITLHFYLMDILRERALTVREIMEHITEEYLSCFEKNCEIDESTLRKKLKEYVGLGIIAAEKRGREMVYRRNESEIEIEELVDAAAFASEQCPVGVIGSYLADCSDYLRFKHHYILNTLDSQIMCELLLTMSEGKTAEIHVHSRRKNIPKTRSVYPVKIYISTQTGRQYLLGFENFYSHPKFYRLDSINSVKIGEDFPEKERFARYLEKFEQHLWGVSSNRSERCDHVEMILHIGENEEYIVQRLEREKRCGKVTRLSAEQCMFSADVYDAVEMLPWIRTFIGRIDKLECTNPALPKMFYEDLAEMRRLYGGDEDAVS
ncbi:MAG: WYL domain-containing protein [Christensenellaceae bacterium]|nr:WYL domain-containing protein [Christensenellaceae bacterium]